MTGLLLLLLPAVALAVGNTDPDQQIVNGANVDIAYFPWQGSFRTAFGSHSCGCVFVGYGWVLTAAHCGGSTAYSMEFGSSRRGYGKVYGVQWLIRHPSYEVGLGTLPNDITIVGATSIISGTNIYPGKIASNSFNPGGTAWITGWGKTCGNCGLSTDLRGVELNVISDSDCNSFWGVGFQSSKMICVYNGRSGACQGDSGGPMNKGDTIYGLTSWGTSNCNTGYPSVYTRVGAYHSWICGNTYNEVYGC